MDASPPRTAVLEIEGMTCDDCSRHVTQALEGLGLDAVSVSWPEGQARFTWSEAVSEDDLRAAISGAGYRPGALRVAQSPSATSGGNRGDLDLVVLGAGSAAFAAAIKAREAGHRVVLVEEGVLGGTCVNVGCVPSKALLRPAELAWSAAHHPFDGLSTSSGPLDLAAMVAQKDALVDDLRRTKYLDLVDAYGLEVVSGHGRFVGPDSLQVGGRTLRADRFLVATGASPAVPPLPGLAEVGYLTSTTALGLKALPRRLAVIGASAIGLELGQFFLHAGVEVTLLEIAERVAPSEEPEVSDTLEKVLTSQGAAIHTGAQLIAARTSKGLIEIQVRVDETEFMVVADQILVATGRRPNTEGLGLRAAGVEIDGRGAIAVDDQLRTTNPRVFAAGDVTGAPQFVYVAAYQGALAAENALLDAGRAVDLTGLPRVTFTSPQIASAGVTEAQVRQSGHEVSVSVIGLESVPRALVNRDTRGLVKLVAEASTGRLLGASLLAEGAGDVIQSAVLAIRHNLTTAELASTFHPYLTMAEGLKLASQAFTRDVSKLSCCAA